MNVIIHLKPILDLDLASSNWARCTGTGFLTPELAQAWIEANFPGSQRSFHIASFTFNKNEWNVYVQ